MSDTVDIAWIRDRLASSAGISDARAGELIQAAMLQGVLNAVAAYATRRPESTATHHTDEDFSEEDFVIPQAFWESAQVSWHEKHFYFRFFHKRQVWLASLVSVDRDLAEAFLQANDPLRRISLVAEKSSVGRKGSGGAPPKVDWEKCLIEAARWMYVNGRPRTQAELIRYIEGWLGDAAPGSTQLKLHLGPLYQAFEQADRSD